MAKRKSPGDADVIDLTSDGEDKNKNSNQGLARQRRRHSERSRRDGRASNSTASVGNLISMVSNAASRLGIDATSNRSTPASAAQVGEAVRGSNSKISKGGSSSVKPEHRLTTTATNTSTNSRTFLRGSAGTKNATSKNSASASNKTTRYRNEDDEDDECIVVERPAKKVNLEVPPTNAGGNDEDDDDLMVIGTANETRLPHMRQVSR